MAVKHHRDTSKKMKSFQLHEKDIWTVIKLGIKDGELGKERNQTKIIVYCSDARVKTQRTAKSNRKPIYLN